MKNFFTVILILIVLVGTRSWGQATGDFGTTGTTVSWGASTTSGTGWVVCVTPGGWGDAVAATRQPNTASDNVWIRTGCTATPSGSPRLCNNLTVENGATLQSATTFSTVRYIRVHGTTATIDGVFGTASSVTDPNLYDGLAFEIYNTTGTITLNGSGTFAPARLRTIPLTTSTTTSFVFNMDAKMMWDGTSHTGGSCIFPQVTTTPTTPPTFTINAGKTVTFVKKGGIGTSSNSGAPSSPVVGMTLIVNGSMVLDSSAKISFVPGTGTTGSMTIGASGSVSLNGPFYFGDISFTNNGTLTYGQFSSLRYYGSSAQVTGSELPVSLPGLTINNAAGVTLGGSTTVNGLTLTTGLLTLGANNLTIEAIGGTPSSTAMVVATGAGELRKTFSADGSFTFPVGDNTGTAEYSPVALTMSAGGYSSAYVGVKLSNTKDPNNSSVNDYINRYWTMTASGVTSPSYSATFTYLPADVVGTELNLVGGKYDGSWTVLGAVNDVAHTFTGNSLTTFSTFSAAESGALPVELVAFTADPKHRSVELAWKTASEKNNRGFDVQKNMNGTWNTLAFIEGNGTSNIEHGYSFVDAAASGKVQYRLKQIDNDGKFTYSAVVNAVVALTAEDYRLSQNYPNPFNPSTRFSFAMKSAEQTTVKVYNILGKEVATLFNGISVPNQLYTLTFDAKDLSSGIYFYSLRSETRKEIKKMMLMK